MTRQLGDGRLDEDASAGQRLVQTSRANLGRCLMQMKRYEEAEPILLACHEQMMASLGAEHPNTAGAAEKLRELYTAWGRPEDVTRYTPLAGSNSDDARD